MLTTNPCSSPEEFRGSPMLTGSDHTPLVSLRVIHKSNPPPDGLRLLAKCSVRPSGCKKGALSWPVNSRGRKPFGRAPTACGRSLGHVQIHGGVAVGVGGGFGTCTGKQQGGAIAAEEGCASSRGRCSRRDRGESAQPRIAGVPSSVRSSMWYSVTKRSMLLGLAGTGWWAARMRVLLSTEIAAPP